MIIDSQAVKNTCNVNVASKGYCFTNQQMVWWALATSSIKIKNAKLKKMQNETCEIKFLIFNF
ncbi:hypothetical protein PN499_16150 [Kamptonema animale CS-326]|jgi:hypothetical protein|uniref:hypothetical protein n=1 Tax=Kamptonema animale TaxID=92934 RepID=UPI00232EF58A|nr:hypothetical protein [Kamptonema animale]MDB9512721.1 hypothetical protein [Kamptonema animale CS-326]